MRYAGHHRDTGLWTPSSRLPRLIKAPNFVQFVAPWVLQSEPLVGDGVPCLWGKQKNRCATPVQELNIRSSPRASGPFVVRSRNAIRMEKGSLLESNGRILYGGLTLGPGSGLSQP